MILAGIAANTGFSAREIEAFERDRALFWWNALAEFNKRVREESS